MDIEIKMIIDLDVIREEKSNDNIFMTYLNHMEGMIYIGFNNGLILKIVIDESMNLVHKWINFNVKNIQFIQPIKDIQFIRK